MVAGHDALGNPAMLDESDLEVTFNPPEAVHEASVKVLPDNTVVICGMVQHEAEAFVSVLGSKVGPDWTCDTLTLPHSIGPFSDTLRSAKPPPLSGVTICLPVAAHSTWAVFSWRLWSHCVLLGLDHGSGARPRGAVPQLALDVISQRGSLGWHQVDDICHR